MRRSVLLALVIVLAAPYAAHAQIYVKRDERGVLVLSDQPLGEGALTFEVPKSAGLRVTRAADLSAVARYADVIERHASRHHVRPELVRAVIQVESGFNPFARSHKGAMGLMQLMPETAADYGVVDAYNPAENIRAGVAYLRALLDRYSGNEELALAAYNAGPGAVERFGQRVPPYRETRDYVRKVKGRTGGTLAASRAPVFVYKVVEIVDGRPIPRYSNVRPASGPYEVVRSFN
jgi:soluble lytic murein transglycosylase-like protein